MLIKNFRNIGEVTLDFTQSPIISLIGENESGKTSIVKAFGVLALHATPRDQKDFIRDGTSGFGVAIQLADDTLITRMKTSTINRYTIKYPDGKTWETGKIDSGLPMPVNELMGLIEEPETKEFLHIRTYEDQLLFVVTSPSTNYKVMYDALKVDQLTKAIKIGSTQANSIKSKINTNEVSIKTLTDNLKQIRLYELQPLFNIRDRLKSELSQLDKIEAAISLIGRNNELKKELGSLNLIRQYNVQSISEHEAYRLTEVYRLLNSRQRLISCKNVLNKCNTLERIDESQIIKMQDILNRIQIIEEKKRVAASAILIKSESMVDESLVAHLQMAITIKTRINSLYEQLNRINTQDASLVSQSDFNTALSAMQVISRITMVNRLKQEYESYITYVEQMTEYMKTLGVATSNCPKCGETVIFDLSKLDK